MGLRARGLEGRHFGGGTAAGSTPAGTARFPVDHGGALGRGRATGYRLRPAGGLLSSSGVGDDGPATQTRPKG